MKTIKIFLNFWVVVAIIATVITVTSWLFNIPFWTAVLAYVVLVLIAATILHMCDIDSGE
jgi:hypothetical protein